MKPAEPPDLPDLFRRQRAHFPVVRRLGAAARAARLRRLRDAIRRQVVALREALAGDFGKPACETDLTEVLSTQTEISFCARGVGRWMKPRRTGTPWLLFGTRSRIVYEPKGVVLILGAWNYPFNLSLAPLAAALAAGNCVVLKPSERTPRTAGLIARIVREVFPPEEVAVVEGGPDVAEALLALPFDHIFYTGSSQVGRMVMTRAATRLIPVTLELGGKSPVIVDASADLSTAAERIAWGKFLNGGQTCIAPDFALVPEACLARFLDEFRAAVARFFGPDAEAQLRSPDLASLIHDAAFERLRSMIEASLEAGARLEMGGRYDAGRRRIAPTVLSGVTFDMPVMAEEIFGPILPVISYRDRAGVYERLRQMPKPLALYIFSGDEAVTEEILQSTAAGGTTINHTILHVANPGLPFGGDGPSGMGKYHGRHGFETFSNARGVLRQGWPDLTRPLYPPYTPRSQWLLDWMRRLFG